MEKCKNYQKENSNLEEWHVILNTLNGNRIVPVSPDNNPEKSGQYLCTCVTIIGSNENRYLRVMEYDAVRNQWYDIGNKSGISHTILAWKKKISVHFLIFIMKMVRFFQRIKI